MFISCYSQAEKKNIFSYSVIYSSYISYFSIETSLSVSIFSTFSCLHTNFPGRCVRCTFLIECIFTHSISSFAESLHLKLRFFPSSILYHLFILDCNVLDCIVTMTRITERGGGDERREFCILYITHSHLVIL